MVLAFVMAMIVSPACFYAGYEFVSRNPRLFRDNSSDEVPPWFGGLLAALFPPLGSVCALLMLLKKI